MWINYTITFYYSWIKKSSKYVIFQAIHNLVVSAIHLFLSILAVFLCLFSIFCSALFYNCEKSQINYKFERWFVSAYFCVFCCNPCFISFCWIFVVVLYSWKAKTTLAHCVFLYLFRSWKLFFHLFFFI